MRNSLRVDEQALRGITRGAFPASKKKYVHPELRVPFREIALKAPAEPAVVYDTSGPYTDPSAELDLQRGLPAIRDGWIRARGDVEELAGISSEYGRARLADTRLDGLRFKGTRRPLAAKRGGNVTQMHWARKGEITPEMRFVAIREGLAPEWVRDEIARG
ncbi:MAG TPA: phosphomethylpyrimidine synthase ThiC, partial [Myxococcaceae bacterium]|nr:phosphomethylpyrimidine synthase ThiC [Myxococcaceae bacterium]